MPMPLILLSPCTISAGSAVSMRFSFGHTVVSEVCIVVTGVRVPVASV